MRVAVVTTWFPDGASPATAPFVVAHATAVARRHDVTVVHLRLGGRGAVVEEEYRGVRVVRVPVDPRLPLHATGALRTLAGLLRPADVVHSMAFSTVGVLAPLTPVIMRRWVHSEHWSGVGFPERVDGPWRRVAGARHLLRLPRRVSAVSSLLAERITPFTRLDAVEVVPCVVDVPAQPTPAPAGGRWGLVAVGGLVPGKRPILAVETVRELVDRGVDVGLTWVGDGPLRTQVEERSRALDVADRVRLVGSVPPQGVAQHLARNALFFLPTAFETFLVSGAEALAGGRPVVLTGEGGFVDYVDETVGTVVADDSVGGLAEALVAARARFDGVPPEHFRAAVLPRLGSEAIGRLFDDFYGRALS